MIGIATKVELISWIALPVLVAVMGVVWIDTATSHFETVTGRTFYGLAGQHYSVPDWRFEYHAGGERIHRWTTIVPTRVAAAVLLASALGAISRIGKRSWPRILAVVFVHLLVAAAFLIVVAYYDINITGVFI